MILTILFTSMFVALAGLHIFTRYSYRGRLANKLKGSFAFPIFGNLLHFNVTCPHELWKLVRANAQKYYPISRLWYVRSAVISIYAAEDVEILLTSQKAIDKGYVYDHLQPWLRTGLLTSTGDKWRARRKLLTPGFHFNILKKYFVNMDRQSERSIDNLKNEGDIQVKNLMRFSEDITLNIICEAAMGVILDKLDSNVIKKYKKAIHDFGYVVIYRIPRPYIFNWMMKPVWKIGRMQRDSLKILHDFTNQIVKERKAYHESTNYKFLKGSEDSDKSEIDLERKKRLSMLDLLLEAEQKGLIDYEGIKEEVDTFTFEGHDTTGMSLTFTLMLLAENKEAQDRARIEVTEIFDRNQGKIEISDLSEFTYLELCIKESLRLYPSVSTILRYIDEDLQLVNGLIPGKSHIMVSIFELHRDSRHWPEPDKFDPERFLPEQAKGRHPFAYVPFSAGPRNCIGQKFAMMELKMVLARILYNFYLEPIDRTADLKLTADLVIRPLTPVHIKFVRINSRQLS